MDSLREDLNNVLNRISPGFDTTETVSYMIYGAAITATRAFEGATLKINADSNRVFVAVRLRWWARFRQFRILRDAWLNRAQKRCEQYTPEGWKVLVYYEENEQSREKK